MLRHSCRNSKYRHLKRLRKSRNAPCFRKRACTKEDCIRGIEEKVNNMKRTFVSDCGTLPDNAIIQLCLLK
ncbi:Hypothetical predicted protein [Octopus vulgaris]|uniref:Uncharacterized protein n=1 Tax=Octopus vulgaris TaxID=6645 RepID=A0AA36F3Z8_OCTVU|nr:Hypothetical predicted protein [Octopus vulgaris]